MRRETILGAIDEVWRLLRRSDIEQSLDTLRVLGVEGGDFSRVMDAWQRFVIAYAHLSPLAVEVMENVGLSHVNNPSTWGSMSGIAPAAQKAHAEALRRDLAIGTNRLAFWDRVIRVKEEIAAGQEPIALLLPTPDGEGVSPDRLIDALQGIQLLYNAFADLYQLPRGSLVVLACDTGSDFSFQLVGAGDVVREVRELIMGLWDRIAFRRERKQAEQLNTIISALPALEQIGQMEADNKIGNEEAQRVRHMIIEGLERLHRGGTILAEQADRASQVSIRQIAMPAPKLLAETASAGAPEEPTPGAN